MRIWWCQEHEAAGTKQDPEWCDEGRRMNHRHKCRMVPMRLLPDDARTMKLSVWWCTEHDASFQREAIPGPPTWDCWAGPIEDEHCVPILLDAFKADGETP